MKKFAITLTALVLTAATLAGCLEIDLSRTNGNQKTDDAVDTVE